MCSSFFRWEKYSPLSSPTSCITLTIGLVGSSHSNDADRARENLQTTALTYKWMQPVWLWCIHLVPDSMLEGTSGFIYRFYQLVLRTSPFTHRHYVLKGLSQTQDKMNSRKNPRWTKVIQVGCPNRSWKKRQSWHEMVFENCFCAFLAESFEKSYLKTVSPKERAFHLFYNPLLVI